MSKRTFQQILEAAGYEAQDYSPGFGEQCLAVTLPRTRGLPSSLGRLFADVLETVDAEENEIAAHAFRRMRDDSLGRSLVVYFPGVKFAE